MLVTMVVWMMSGLAGPATDGVAVSPAPSPPSVLHIGDITTADVDESDPVITTEVLREQYAGSLVHGKAYRVEIPAGRTATFELRSYFFDSYLVLRDTNDKVLAEDDDGLIVNHSRIIHQPRDEDTAYRLEACALRSGLGSFELRIVEGEPDALTPQDRRAAVLADTNMRVATVESALGAEHPATAEALNSLAEFLYDSGDFAGAQPVFERALAIRETALGPEAPLVSQSLNNLALLLHEKGDLERARPLFERSLRIMEASFGVDHPYTASVVNNLAALSKFQGDYAAAHPLYERALSILEAKLGPDHPETANSLNNLAELLREQGDYAAARPLFERALRINEAAFGPTARQTATTINNIARLLGDQGDIAGARRLLERVIEMDEANFGENHPLTAISVNNLASLLTLEADLPRAQALLERTLRINESMLGPTHQRTAEAMNNLARVLYERRDYAKTVPLYERAIRTFNARLGPDHPTTAITVNNLAISLHTLGDDARARALHERAVRTHERTLGANHPITAKALANLATLLFDHGETKEAMALAKRALQVSQAQRDRLVWSLTESERLLFAEVQRVFLRLFLSIGELMVSDAKRDAYETVLEWKSQVLRSLSTSRGQALARLSKENQKIIEEIGQVQTRLSKELFNKEIADRDAHQALLGALRTKRLRLETELNRSLGAAEEKSTVSSFDLSGALPDDAVLVDFFVHQVVLPLRLEGTKIVRERRLTAPRLSAWILQSEEKGEVQWLDLGDVLPIERATKAFLEDLVASRGITLAEPEDEPAATSRFNDELRSLLWDPIKEHVKDGTKRIFVSPDSFLGSLPFEVLQEKDGSFLIEDFAFVYLQDALSLARAEANTSSPPAPDAASLLCVGGIDYRKRDDLAWQKPAGSSEGKREDSKSTTERLASSQRLARADLRASLRGAFGRRWSPLPATRDEAITIAALHAETFEDASRVVLLKREATEERIKHELPRHRTLHLATHGFFQPEGLPSMWEQARNELGRTEMVMREEEKRLTGLLPGLLSGLVLSGADNVEPAGNRDDGLFTAEELSFLDLSKVDLVVLSACESGLGRPQGGEGMLGLRRAFRAAGAKTVISSLWKVSDEATNELMRLFYERLWLDGESKQSALRGAQLDMLKKNRIEHDGDGHPSTWGAFVLDGAWR